MNLQSVRQALQDPNWIAAILAVIGLIAAAIKFLIITPRQARKQAEKEVVRNLLRFLEDHRVLYSDFAQEHVSEAINSLFQIRKRLGKDIERLDDDSDAARPVREMQAACTDSLSQIPRVSEGQAVYENPKDTIAFVRAVSALRTVFDSRTDWLYEK